MDSTHTNQKKFVRTILKGRNTLGHVTLGRVTC